jgi:hypothetical protein
MARASGKKLWAKLFGRWKPGAWQSASDGVALGPQAAPLRLDFPKGRAEPF